MTGEAPRRRSPEGARLAGPLARYVPGGLDEAAAQRMWHGIASRLPASARAGRRRWLLRAAAAAVALAGVLAGWRLVAWEGPGEPSPLALVEGGPFESVEGSNGAPRSVLLSDGSRVEASAGSRVEVLASTSTEVSLVVRRGRARFSVTPGGPRRWRIEARGVHVEVVGTVLSVQAKARSVEVEVEVGAVVVRSPALVDGVARLLAGGRLELPAASGAEAALGEASSPAPLPSAPSALSSVPAATQARASSGLDTAPPGARRARRAPARRSRPSPALQAEPAAARQLWARADAARAAGDAALAATLLEQLLDDYPGDARASLAAFTLGTVLEAEPQRAARAARAFRRALELGLPSALRDACYARLAAALYAAGDLAAVRSLASEYRASSPAGEQRATIEALERKAAALAPPAPGSPQ